MISPVELGIYYVVVSSDLEPYSYTAFKLDIPWLT
jgi:hypothetical protein